jgi:outer membrane receptor for ferrienterochelin and colicins
MPPRAWALMAVGFMVAVCPLPAVAAEHGAALAGVIRDIDDVSIEDLLKVPITAAARHEQEVAQAPSSATVITAEEIEAHGYETIAQVLRGLAGFYTTDDLSYTYVGARGFSPPGDYNMRILVLVDGHPVNDVIWSSASVGTDGPIDLDLVDRIEVVRGPGSALYGTSAILAVVQIITKSAAHGSSPEAFAETGSHDRIGGGIRWSGLLGHTSDLQLSVSGMKRNGQAFHFSEFESTPSRGYTDRDGDRNGRVYGTFRTGDFRFSGLHSSRTKHLPTGEWESIFDDEATSVIDTREYLEISYGRTPSANTDVSIRAYADRYSSHGVWPYDASIDSTLGVEGRRLSRDESDVVWGGAEVRAGWAPSAVHRLIGGGGFHVDRGSVRNLWKDLEPGVDRVTLDIHKNTSFFSFYGQEEYTPTRRLSLTLGLHYDRYETWGGTLTPRAGLVVGPISNTHLKLLFGRGFRAPSMGEATYEDGTTQVANPNLDPERITSMEGVLERVWASFFWTRVSAYRNEMTDLIQIMERDDGLVEYRNAGEVEVHGLELDMRSVPRKGLTIEANASRQDARDERTRERSWNSPRWTANLGITASLLGRAAMLGFGGRYVGDRLGANGETARSYVAADANLLWRTPLSGLEAVLRIENVTDRAYADPAGDGDVVRVIPQYGRTWRFVIRFRPGGSGSGEDEPVGRERSQRERRGGGLDPLARLCEEASAR